MLSLGKKKKKVAPGTETPLIREQLAKETDREKCFPFSSISEQSPYIHRESNVKLKGFF